jgi:hypothetical protein
VIDFARWKAAELGESWRNARPFPHIVLDDFVDEATLQTLCQAIAQEPHWPNRGEIYDMMGSADTVQHPTLRAFHEELGAPGTLEAVRAISGRPVSRAELRSYVYMPGSYLLPHSDCQTGLGREVAFAYYLWSHGCVGGELELFDVELENGFVARSRSARLIEPRGNRMVMFAVTPASLHQVREVLGGARLSLAGWFHA